MASISIGAEYTTTISEHQVHGWSGSISEGISLVPVDFHAQLSYSNLYKGWDAVFTQLIGGSDLRHVWFGIKKIQDMFN